MLPLIPAGAGAWLLDTEPFPAERKTGDPRAPLDYGRRGSARVSWPSVIILVSAERRPSLEGRIRSLKFVPDPVTGGERLHQHGYSYCISTPTTTRSCRRASSSRWWTVAPDGTGVANRAQISSRPAHVGLLSPAGPNHDGSQIEYGLAGNSKPVRPHCKASPLLDQDGADHALTAGRAGIRPCRATRTPRKHCSMRCVPGRGSWRGQSARSALVAEPGPVGPLP
jgi:hypothetical protein